MKKWRYERRWTGNRRRGRMNKRLRRREEKKEREEKRLRNVENSGLLRRNQYVIRKYSSTNWHNNICDFRKKD